MAAEIKFDITADPRKGNRALSVFEKKTLLAFYKIKRLGAATFGKLKRTVSAFKKAGVFAFKKIALPITAVSAGIAVLMKTTANAGDQFQKMSLKLGISAQALSEFKHAAEISGTTIETFQTGIRTMAKRMNDAVNGLSTAKRSFESLGVKVLDVNGNLRKADEVFMDASKALGKLESETQKTALAQELFGRSGTELLPLMKSGAGGIAALRKEARGLGITFSDVEANQAAAFNDSMLRVKNVFIGIKNTIAKILLPSFTALAESFAQTMKKTRKEGTLDVWATNVSKGVIDAFFVMVEFITGIPMAFHAVMSSLKKMASFIVTLGKAIVVLADWTLVPIDPKVHKSIDDLAVSLLVSAYNSDKAGEKWAAWSEKSKNAIDEILKRSKKLEKMPTGAKIQPEAVLQPNSSLSSIPLPPPTSAFLKTNEKILQSREKLENSLIALKMKSADKQAFLLGVELRNVENTLRKELTAAQAMLKEGTIKKWEAVELGIEYENKALATKQVIFEKMSQLNAKISQKEKEEQEKRLQNVFQMLGEMKNGWAGFQEFRIQQLNEIQEKLIAANVSAAEIIRWRTEQEKRIIIEKNKFILEHTDSLLEALKATWSIYMEERKGAIQEFSSWTVQAFEQMTQGFGNAIGRMVVYGERFGKSMKKVWKSLQASFISMLAQMLAKEIIFFAISKALALKDAIVKIMAKAGQLFINIYNAIAGIPFVGPFLAPVMAAAGTAAAVMGAKSLISQAHGGLENAPRDETFLIRKGERIIQPAQNRDLTKFLEQQKAPQDAERQSINMTLNLNAIDGQNAKDFLLEQGDAIAEALREAMLNNNSDFREAVAGA